MQKPPGNDPRRLMWSRRPISRALWPAQRNREPNRSRLCEPEPLLLYPLTHERINSAAALMAL